MIKREKLEKKIITMGKTGGRRSKGRAREHILQGLTLWQWEQNHQQSHSEMSRAEICGGVPPPTPLGMARDDDYFSTLSAILTFRYTITILVLCE